MSRTAAIARKTAETDITLSINLDGQGTFEGTSGIGFFDHMLVLLARHALMDITLCCKGDLQVDGHHTVEDIGICLGQAIAQALGNKAGIRRYGQMMLPMDEVLMLCALDLSGRPYLAMELTQLPEKIGQFDSELVEEFFRAVSMNSGMNLHLKALAGGNGHHVVEAAFKAFARALRGAVEMDGRDTRVPSTKGAL
nr:imidazoleglycerol-phosphate dehydratase HisB [bacterium]